ncbi:MAG: response regulator [Flavisolibacter sp.]
MNSDIKIAIVDDHALLRKGLAGLVTGLGYKVIADCSNGKEFIQLLEKGKIPDVVLMDINMPLMDGFETTLWLKSEYPLIKVLALSMYDDENAIIRMLKNGAKGYLLKDVEPQELKRAVDSLVSSGFYYSEMITGRLVHNIQNMDDDETYNRQLKNLNEKEIEFLKLASTEMTYKEIANFMNLSPRTIDGYRDNLFEKLKLKSRVGLVLFSIKNGLVHVN